MTGAKWKFTKVGEDWFCFAGLWRPMPDGAGDAFTLLTTEPGPDVAPIHNRQMVVLDRADWVGNQRAFAETVPNPPPAGYRTCLTSRLPSGSGRSSSASGRVRSSQASSRPRRG
jgi:hypothetical protein